MTRSQQSREERTQPYVLSLIVPNPLGGASGEQGQPSSPAFLTIREAANRLGLSERSVYGYIEDGRLPWVQEGKRRMVDAEAVAALIRQTPGRVRTTAPDWHRPPKQNPLTLTTITARLLPGQQDALETKVQEICQQHAHCVPGTAARYLIRDRDNPQKIVLILVWRASGLPSSEERQKALAALYADLETILDWSSAIVEEGEALLHA